LLQQSFLFAFDELFGVGFLFLLAEQAQSDQTVVFLDQFIIKNIVIQYFFLHGKLGILAISFFEIFKGQIDIVLGCLIIFLFLQRDFSQLLVNVAFLLWVLSGFFCGKREQPDG